MATQRIELGPSGERLRRNVQRRRKELGLDLAALSERLADLGRPIGVSGLSKLEQGTRRVDADDLVALSAALDASPGWMLLAPVSIVPTVAPLTNTAQFASRALWEWITGLRPLDLTKRDNVTESFDRAKAWEFAGRNRPTEARRGPVAMPAEWRSDPDFKEFENVYRRLVGRGIQPDVLDALFFEIRDETNPITFDSVMTRLRAVASEPSDDKGLPE